MEETEDKPIQAISGPLNLSCRPRGAALEEFIDLLEHCDQAIRTSTSPELSFDGIFGQKAANLLGFRKGYVAAIDVTDDTFRIVRLVMPEVWENDGDKEVIERYVGTKRPIATAQGRLVKKLTDEKRSYLTSSFQQDENISAVLRETLQMEIAIASPFVVFNEVVGFVLLGFNSVPTPEIQWCNEHLVAHAAVTAMQSFWMSRFRKDVELNMKWKMLGQQAAALVHAMKTPIGKLQNHLASLALHKDITDNHKATIKRAEDALSELRWAVANQLAFVQVINLHKTQVQVRQLLLDAASASKVGTAAVELKGKDLDKSIYVDSDKMALVFRNLLDNAYEAQPSEKGKVQLIAEAAEDEIALSVVDNGPGLSSQALSHLFEPFFSTKNIGHGLGLAVAERYVKEHGGRLHVTNRADGGACFSVILPFKGFHITGSSR